jgi:hypothetical protein
MLRRWDEDGLSWPEAWYLQQRGYERWVRSDRVTAEMAVELLLRELELLEQRAATPAISSPEDERHWLQQILLGKRLTGLDPEEEALLEELSSLDTLSPTQQQRRWQSVRHDHLPALSRLFKPLDDHTTRRGVTRFGRGRNSIVVANSEEADRHHRAERLRRELGPRILDPQATMSYRAARVRKWRQLERAGRQPHPW